MVGTVCMVDEPENDHNGEPSGRLIPYIVELDGATSRLISVPCDVPEYIVPETCWPDVSAFHKSGPFPPALAVKPPLRFSVGDAVVCLVGGADQTNGGTWAHGDVVAVWAQRPQWRFARDGTPEAAAYAIRLSGGSGVVVLCHRDEHSLVRDPSLQPAGAATRESATRFAKRRRDDGQAELIDHQTRKRRVDGACAAPTSASPAAVIVEMAGSDMLFCGECESQVLQTESG